MTRKLPNCNSKKTVNNNAGAVWPVFLTAHAVLIERVESRLADAGLPPLCWYDVLWTLERADGYRVRLADLAHRVVLSRSNITRLIDRLVDAGLVMRERVSEDGRGYHAVLTPAGKAQRAKMWPIYKTAIATLFESHLKPAEAIMLNAVLRRILIAARDQQAQ